MIPTSTSPADAVRHTPPWLTGPDATVYLLRGGSVRERGALEAELSGPHRAGKVYAFELAQLVRAGVEQFMADDPEQERVLALLDQEDAVDTRADEALVAGRLDEEAAIRAELADADRQLLEQVRGVLREHFAPYRELIAQQMRRRELAPIEAMRRFLVGIENGADFARDREGMTAEATLAAIDPLELMNAGNVAYAMLYGGGQKRPLGRPSPSGGAPKSSRRVRSNTAG